MATSGSQLPPHVKRYLDKSKVRGDDLPAEVLEFLGGLSVGEIALLTLLGEALREAGVSTETAANVH